MTTGIFLLMVGIVNAACLHGNPREIEEEFDNSHAVFVGRILSETSVPQSGSRYYKGKNYYVEIQELFKGSLTKTITIFSENSSGRFPMIVGQTYLVFVYDDGRCQIDNCGNSGLASEKPEMLKAIRLLKNSEREKDK